MRGRALAILALLAVLGLAVLVTADRLLASRIEIQRQAADERILLDLLPAGSYDNHPLSQPIALPPDELLGDPSPAHAWLATRQGVPVAVLLPSIARGYEGPIHLLLAIGPDGRLLASKVLSQRETPGIGDRIELSRGPWLRVFEGVSLANHPETKWRVRADGGRFDQLAGATITSRAVVNATQRALRFFDSHRTLLLAITGESSP